MSQVSKHVPNIKNVPNIKRSQISKKTLVSTNDYGMEPEPVAD